MYVGHVMWDDMFVLRNWELFLIIYVKGINIKTDGGDQTIGMQIMGRCGICMNVTFRMWYEFRISLKSL